MHICVYIYIEPREEHCSLAAVFLFTPDNSSSLLSITYIDLHWVCHGNSLSFGDRAGIPLPLTPQLTPFRWLAIAEAQHGLSSDSHKSRNPQQMLDHLIHCAASPEPAKAYSPWPGNNQGDQGALTPPHSSITRVLITSGHDLVAISMGPGGWVFKTKLEMLCIMLEPKWT